MKITSKRDYLKGIRFTNELQFPISNKAEKVTGKVNNRIDIICEICKNKNVLHLGACDHIEIIQDKIQNHSWLHQRIMEVSKTCVGIDYNKKSIQYLKDNYAIDNILHADVTKSLPKELENYACKWDYVIAGEIVEHIPNPQKFLESLRTKLHGQAENLIITVPNAFRLTNFLHCFKGIEFINSDHRFWFSPYTISKILCDSGFYPVKFDFYDFDQGTCKLGVRSRILHHLRARWPSFKDGILICAQFNEDRESGD